MAKNGWSLKTGTGTGTPEQESEAEREAIRQVRAEYRERRAALEASPAKEPA